MALREVQTCSGWGSKSRLALTCNACGAPARGSSCEYCKAEFERADEFAESFAQYSRQHTGAYSVSMMSSAGPRGRLAW